MLFAFWGLVDAAAHLWGYMPPKAHFGSVFKPNAQNIQTFLLSELLQRIQPNFAQ